MNELEYRKEKANKYIKSKFYEQIDKLFLCHMFRFMLFSFLFIAITLKTNIHSIIIIINFIISIFFNITLSLTRLKNIQNRYNEEIICI